MVAIKNHEADRFVSSLPEHIFAYLIFGTDPGLIRERARLIFRKVSAGQDEAFSTVRLSGDEITSDPSRLADEAYSIGLFGGKRAIWVEPGSKNVLPFIEPLFATPPQDCVLLIEGGQLKRDSALRSLFERARTGAAIECFPDTEDDLLRLIAQEVRNAGLSISDDARHELVAHLGSDRAATRAEVDKLITYAIGKEVISLKDIEAVVADASTLAIDAAIGSAFLGHTEEVTDTSARAFETGNDPGVVLGFALRHGVTLHRAKLGIAGGGTSETAMGMILRGNRSPVLRKRASDQLAMWSPVRLLRAVDTIAEAIRRCRREPKLDDIIAIRAMWSVALIARGRD